MARKTKIRRAGLWLFVTAAVLLAFVLGSHHGEAAKKVEELAKDTATDALVEGERLLNKK